MEWNISFDADGAPVGKLCYDHEAKELKFEGDANASGRLFFEYVCEQFNLWHTPQLEQLQFNLKEAYTRIEMLKKQVLELELAVATQPE